MCVFATAIAEPLQAQEGGFDSAMQARADGDFALAETLLQQLLLRDETDAQLWFHLGLVQRFQSQLNEAMASQVRARALAPDDQDIAVEIARIYAARGETGLALTTLGRVLDAQPSHQEAWTLHAQLQNRSPAAMAARRSWRIDFGAEHSAFARQIRDDWWQSFVQLGHRYSEDTASHVRLEQARRFGTVNQHIELGLNHRLTPDYATHISLGYTPAADFLPLWRLRAGAGWRNAGYTEGLGMVGLDLDVQHDRYQAIATTAIKPGVRIGLGQALDAQLQHIGIVDEHHNYLSGWSTRVNWQVPNGNSRFFAGLADAPETENARTVDTKAAFVGASYEWRDGNLVHLSYAREDREDAYVRKVTSLAFSVMW